MKDEVQLDKALGTWSLVAIGLGGVIGSGWLFSASYAAQAAGPASILSWGIGGALALLIALAFAELGMAKPESGALVRYPLYSNGRLAASIVGWCLYVAYLTDAPTESAAMIQYASTYTPGLFAHGTLTRLGILVAVLIMAVFVVINWFGARLFARTNNVVTAVKICVPFITVALLFASGFRTENITMHGGLAPYGWGAAFSAIVTTGIMNAYIGFRNIVDMSGEVRNPRKSIPKAMIITIVVTIVLYIGLELAFVGAVPRFMLAHGWHGVTMSSPFAQLAVLLNLSVLYWILMGDSVFSPFGAGLVYVGANSRNLVGMARSGMVPEAFGTISRTRRVPTRALLVNFCIGIVLLLLLPSWQQFMDISGTLITLTFATGAITVTAFRRVGTSVPGAQIRGMRVMAPMAFALSALVVFWEPWDLLSKTVPIVLLGVVVFVVGRARVRWGVVEIRAGIWMVVYLVVIYVMSALASSSGVALLAGPVGDLIVGTAALLIYFWAVREGVRFMRGQQAGSVAEREASLKVLP